MHENSTGAAQDSRTNVPELVTRYFTEAPAADRAAERVAFGTSGHRGSSLRTTFNEAHIVAICAAVVEHRQAAGIDGPLFLAMDTHALSEPAFVTALEVFAAHDVSVVIESDSRYTPTPVVSHAILGYNRGRSAGLADGIIITPSHNPPEDGGIKYNPPNGGPADTGITAAIERRANEFLGDDVAAIRRLPVRSARQAARRQDMAGAYIADLESVLDLKAVAAAGVRIGVDPMGGAAVDCWDRIAERYGLRLEVVNRSVDAAFAFMPRDWDGRVRMDCSSPHAMAGLLALKDRFDVAFGNDPDVDRHGIVTPSRGLLNPNHFLAAAIDFLLAHREAWPRQGAIGKTLVSSALIDRVARRRERALREVPVGFKWFVEGLLDGSLVFGGEESAGASFVRHDGSVWTTDKDGILLGLLAAEMTAISGRDPGESYAAIAADLGEPHYKRVDAAATSEQKRALARLSPDAVRAETLAGERIIARLTRAPGNDAPIGGLKIVTENGWFAARPSGTEDVYKIYAESFAGEEHLAHILQEAKAIVSAALNESVQT
jgi:phosphoglucomutase